MDYTKINCDINPEMNELLDMKIKKLKEEIKEEVIKELKEELIKVLKEEVIKDLKEGFHLVQIKKEEYDKALLTLLNKYKENRRTELENIESFLKNHPFNYEKNKELLEKCLKDEEKFIKEVKIELDILRIQKNNLLRRKRKKE